MGIRRTKRGSVSETCNVYMAPVSRDPGAPRVAGAKAPVRP